jgi:hypothetical protein
LRKDDDELYRSIVILLEFHGKIDFPFVCVLDLDRFSVTAGPRGLDLLAQIRFCFHRSFCARAQQISLRFSFSRVLPLEYPPRFFLPGLIFLVR